jgi:hypothetical protein
MYGLYRSSPDEPTIKSDLQFYNKDYTVYGGHGAGGYMRNIKAYAVYAHGDETGERPTAWFIEEGWRRWLLPSKVADLWYSDFDPIQRIFIDVHPTDMILHATVCYGYSLEGSPPYMAKAFVDYGAAAFVGATVLVPAAYNDLFTDNFWERLCQWDNTVKTATQNYVNTHNYFHWQDYWTYGIDIKIYGSETVKLDN